MGGKGKEKAKEKVKKKVRARVKAQERAKGKMQLLPMVRKERVLTKAQKVPAKGRRAPKVVTVLTVITVMIHGIRIRIEKVQARKGRVERERAPNGMTGTIRLVMVVEGATRE